MKRYIFAIILLYVAAASLFAELPTCYHTYDEVIAELTQYEALNPDIAKIHIIGYSQQDNLPIYAMKISDNVLQDEQEVPVLFVGQVHAEEVMGVEITMNNIKEILTNRTQSPYSMWIAQLDMWFVPTLNPEGHNVVTTNLDTSFRKNKRDNNLNGIFDYSTLVGYDIDGADINRNFDYNWVQGDTLMQPGSLEVYDYYRGPAPMSESENQAIAQLFEQKRFAYSIVWHESRTGNLSEKAYYSFNWKEERPSPDVSLAQSIALGIAGQIVKEDGSATYEAYPNLSRKGCFHDWAYQQYGTIQVLIECATANIQPDSLLMVNTVQRCSNGVKWLLNRALPYSTTVPSNSLLTGNITETPSGAPLEAQIVVEQRNAPWFRPRMSNAITGRYYRPVAPAPGGYTVKAIKKGYYDKIFNNVTINNGAMTILNFPMEKRPDATLSGWVHSMGQPIPAKIILYSPVNDTLIINGDYMLATFAGEGYRIEISSDGYFPYLGTIDIMPGQNNLFIDLSPAEEVFSEDWENGAANWSINGPWVLENELSASGYAITDSWGGRGHYAMNCDVNISTVSPITLPSTDNLYLTFDQHLYTEWTFDPVTVELSTDNANWTAIWTDSGQKNYWHTQYISLDGYSGQTVYMRFRLVDQSSAVELTDPGWTIDNIRILKGFVTSNAETVNSVPIVTAVYPNYPNPFNPETTIKYSLHTPSQVRLDIYNMKGQHVRTLVNETKASGNHSVIWNGKDSSGNSVSSGVYFYKMQSGTYSSTHKMILMK